MNYQHGRVQGRGPSAAAAASDGGGWTPTDAAHEGSVCRLSTRRLGTAPPKLNGSRSDEAEAGSGIFGESLIGGNASLMASRNTSSSLFPGIFQP